MGAEWERGVSLEFSEELTKTVLVVTEGEEVSDVETVVFVTGVEKNYRLLRWLQHPQSWKSPQPDPETTSPFSCSLNFTSFNLFAKQHKDNPLVLFL
ncbi:hypothetical protein OVS_03195 [Mycoplasma ovis str. Michigan]|uniref:Uncharacterized protein n=1 Tax=Mycoplasma ovis str. Michigan TaxID=1415773 RepID=A0ABM5P1P9_9MOLU|nr:hypothetical protein OVS_03195 [Mycoplasma ovis str. Michigan]